MQEQDVEDILTDIEHFRILCVGRKGSGKLSLITRIFRLGSDQPVRPAKITEGRTSGGADIEKEYTPEGNKLFALHDSEELEPGIENSVNTLDTFIRQRRDETRPLKEQLHIVWLCIELPTSLQRPFETTDEKVLQLVHDTKTPIVVVFTKYDELLMSKKVEFGDNQGYEEAGKIYHACVQSLKHIVNGMKSPIPVPIFVKVSGRPGYEVTIESLVATTRDLVSSQLKVMWDIAQRASPRVKIEGCVNHAFRGIRFEGLKLDNCLAKVYQNIVPYWNFVDNEKSLGEKEFRDLMLCLVQDFWNLQNLDGPHSTVLTPHFTEWLSKTDLNDELAAQQALMAYAADLITVLNSLFVKVTQASPSEAPRVTRQALNEVYQTHQTSAIRREIYRRISEITARDLSSLLEVYCCLLLQWLGFYPVPPPDSGSAAEAASSALSPGVASSSRSTEVATSPVPRVAQPPPTNAVMPSQSTREPALQPRSDSPSVWSRFIGCLTLPTEMATSSSVTRAAPPSPPRAETPLLSPQSVGVLNITLKSRKAVRTAPSPPFWRYHRP